MSDVAFKMARLEKACRRAKLSLPELIDECREGRSQFFDNPEASAIGTIMANGPFKVYYVMVIGGTLSGGRALLNDIEAFARAQGCQTVLAACRPGMRKPYEEDGQGFKPVATLYEKVL